MTRLEKVYSKWEDLETAYSAVSTKLTREQFLRKLLGADDGVKADCVEQMKALIQKDFIATDDNVRILNSLIRKMNTACKVLSMLDDGVDVVITNLNELVSTEICEEDSEFILTDYDMFMKQESCTGSYLFSKGHALEGAYNDGDSIEVFNVSESDPDYKAFYDQASLLSFLQDCARRESYGQFLSPIELAILACSTELIVNNEISLPIVFVNRDSIQISNKESDLRAGSYVTKVDSVKKVAKEDSIVKFVGMPAVTMKKLSYDVYFNAVDNGVHFTVAFVGGER